MHRTLKAETASPPQANRRAQQRAFDRFVAEFNEDRPHEALGQEPPATRYKPSPRPYPSRLTEPAYPDDWPTRPVSPGGQLRWRGRKIFVAFALVGQRIALEPVEDGLWRLHFGPLAVGLSDERRHRVSPLKRPRRTRAKTRFPQGPPPSDGNEGRPVGGLVENAGAENPGSEPGPPLLQGSLIG